MHSILIVIGYHNHNVLHTIPPVFHERTVVLGKSKYSWLTIPFSSHIGEIGIIRVFSKLFLALARLCNLLLCVHCIATVDCALTPYTDRIYSFPHWLSICGMPIYRHAVANNAIFRVIDDDVVVHRPTTVRVIKPKTTEKQEVYTVYTAHRHRPYTLIFNGGGVIWMKLKDMCIVHSMSLSVLWLMAALHIVYV